MLRQQRRGRIVIALAREMLRSRKVIAARLAEGHEFTLRGYAEYHGQTAGTFGDCVAA